MALVASVTSGLVAPVAWGLATTGTCLLLLLLLLLCSFFHKASRRFSTRERKARPGIVQGVALDPSAGIAALQGGTSSPAELQQPMDGPPMPEDPNKPLEGDPQLQTPPSHLLSGPTQRTPEFLRHRQLPVLPGDPGTAVVTPVPEAEGRIYESIRCKPGMLRKPWEERSGQEDSPSLSPRDEPNIPQLEVTTLEELGRQGNPDPVYAQVVKPPRVPQPLQPQEASQAEIPPSLPGKALPCGTGCPGDVGEVPEGGKLDGGFSQLRAGAWAGRGSSSGELPAHSQTHK